MPSNPDHSNQRGVVVARFGLADPAYPFVGLSQEENCRVALQKLLPRGPGEYAEFFSVHGADPDRVLDLAEESDLVEPALLCSYDDGGLFEFVVGGDCPVGDLAERGAVPGDVVSEDGSGEIVAEILPGVDTSDVIEGFLEAHPTAVLLEKKIKDRPTPLFTRQELRRSVDERLTERQKEVLETAFERGYYDPTTETTGDDLGESLDISPSTVSQHLKAAERKVITILLEDTVQRT